MLYSTLRCTSLTLSTNVQSTPTTNFHFSITDTDCYLQFSYFRFLKAYNIYRQQFSFLRTIHYLPSALISKICTKQPKFHPTLPAHTHTQCFKVKVETSNSHVNIWIPVQNCRALPKCNCEILGDILSYEFLVEIQEAFEEIPRYEMCVETLNVKPL